METATISFLYMQKNSTSTNKNLAVFKPKEEEGFSRGGLELGEGAVREHAAYLLDCSSLRSHRKQEQKDNGKQVGLGLGGECSELGNTRAEVYLFGS